MRWHAEESEWTGFGSDSAQELSSHVHTHSSRRLMVHPGRLIVLTVQGPVAAGPLVSRVKAD